MLKLHSYYRSSAAFRVRIALELKNLHWESVPVNLGSGEQSLENFLNNNGEVFSHPLECKTGRVVIAMEQNEFYGCT